MKITRGVTPLPRGLVVALAAGAALLLPATSALAHVTVNPNQAPQGGYTKLAFRVPNERDDADTTKIEVDFPADHPLASVSVRPHAGWNYTVVKTKLASPIKSDDGDISEAVSQITWTGGAIKPGEFDEFEVSVGPLPDDVDSLTFKTLQTYRDGQVVRWIEEASPGGSEPDHPAPVLKLTKAAPDSGSSTASTATTAPPAQAQGGELATNNAASRRDVDTARTLGILGLIFGLLGFGAGAAGWFRRRPAS